MSHSADGSGNSRSLAPEEIEFLIGELERAWTGESSTPPESLLEACAGQAQPGTKDSGHNSLVSGEKQNKNGKRHQKDDSIKNENKKCKEKDLPGFGKDKKRSDAGQGQATGSGWFFRLSWLLWLFWCWLPRCTAAELSVKPGFDAVPPGKPYYDFGFLTGPDRAPLIRSCAVPWHGADGTALEAEMADSWRRQWGHLLNTSSGIFGCNDAR